jgi:hypothetical protein
MEYHGEEPRRSSGVAKAGLTLGIIGTALGALSGGGGILNGGGFLGGGNTKEISALEAKIAELEGKAYTDAVGLDLYKNIIAQSNTEDAKIAALQKEVTSYVIDLDKRTALNAQAMELNRAYDNMARSYEMTILNNKIDCCCEKANMEMRYNRHLSELADASIISYVNSNFINGQLYLPASSITPAVELA